MDDLFIFWPIEHSALRSVSEEKCLVDLKKKEKKGGGVGGGGGSSFLAQPRRVNLYNRLITFLLYNLILPNADGISL